jgi:hypothetical protein
MSLIESLSNLYLNGKNPSGELLLSLTNESTNNDCNGDAESTTSTTSQHSTIQEVPHLLLRLSKTNLMTFIPE